MVVWLAPHDSLHHPLLRSLSSEYEMWSLILRNDFESKFVKPCRGGDRRGWEADLKAWAHTLLPPPEIKRVMLDEFLLHTGGGCQVLQVGTSQR